ncbi:MAG: MarR family transcriptional regulator [Burkholderiales bacterium PBB3]|nr:MAG: MarR family transcriptional regulator [Burkholderiales bacterium PBB3]
MADSPIPALSPYPIRTTHVGHWLRLALERFDERVRILMAQHPGAPLALANLAGRNQMGAAHIHITRHLAHEGARLTELARSAGMTKQAMGTLVDQCAAWGMVTREDDPLDARARRVCFTEAGLAWLHAYEESVVQAELEMRQAVGDQVSTVIAIGLEAYGAA